MTLNDCLIGSDTQISPTSARVLLVDDEESIRDMCKMTIEFMGHNVDTASSGVEALESLKTGQYDLILTDVTMHGMNGWQLASIIHERYNGTRVVILSGSEDTSTAEYRERCGVESVLVKPVSSVQLGGVINTAIRLRRK